MYTKKLVRSVWTPKEIFVTAAILAVIVLVFSFIGLSNAKSRVDDIYEKEGTVTTDNSKFNFSVDNFGIILAVGAALGGGLGFTAQLITISLQMNISRKNTEKAIAISHLIAAAIIGPAIMLSKAGANYLMSMLCSGRYSVLKDFYTKENITVFGDKIPGGTFGEIAFMMFVVLACVMLGTLFMLALNRCKGAKAFAAVILGLIAVVVGGIAPIALLAGSSYSWMVFAVLALFVAVMSLIHHIMIRKLSFENYAVAATTK